MRACVCVRVLRVCMYVCVCVRRKDEGSGYTSQVVKKVSANTFQHTHTQTYTHTHTHTGTHTHAHTRIYAHPPTYTPTHIMTAAKDEDESRARGHSHSVTRLRERRPFGPLPPHRVIHAHAIARGEVGPAEDEET